jgi:hypothetical protein
MAEIPVLWSLSPRSTRSFTLGNKNGKKGRFAEPDPLDARMVQMALIPSIK